MSALTCVVVGAGGRGSSYAEWIARNPERCQVVAVAEPDVRRREALATAHGIAPAGQFGSWQELAAQPRLADFAIVATQDDEHLAPITALAPLGYNLLIEKPIAPSLEETLAATRAIKQAGVVAAVCHVLRYTRYTTLLRSLVSGGVIGDVMSINHTEAVAWWHQAHSYVRGSWRREDTSSCMLLAKSCHDIDWLQFVVGQRIDRVSSFGRLSHLRPEQRPAGAADRCLDCEIAASCPFDAGRIYGRQLIDGNFTWPLTVVTQERTAQGLNKALREGPYGRCVYACDNDVVDHQVVSMEFEGGATGVFTMTAYTEATDRRTVVHGTRGELTGDGERIRVYDFTTGSETWYDANRTGDPTAAGGHGGGDDGLMEAFVTALEQGDDSCILTDIDESLSSHAAVFAAEQARHAGTVEQVGAVLAAAGGQSDTVA